MHDINCHRTGKAIWMEKAKTVERALRILSAFSKAERELNASELARRLKLSRTIVVRILSTLEAAGFVERKPGDPRYQIGLTAFRIGSLYLTANPLLGFATSCLDKLVNETGCTAYLGVIDAGDAVIIAHREGRHPVRFMWTAGDRLPVTTTAYGKAMLGRLPAEELDRVLGRNGLPGLTERSLRMRAELDAQLHAVRKRGWAAAKDEAALGVNAVGAAIVDAAGYPIAGIAISYVDYPPDPTLPASLGLLVVEEARAISARAAEYGEHGHRLDSSKRSPRSGPHA